jgi:hypothetical protein
MGSAIQLSAEDQGTKFFQAETVELKWFDGRIEARYTPLKRRINNMSTTATKVQSRAFRVFSPI